MKKIGLIAAGVAAVGGALYLNSQGTETHYRYERVVREAYVRALDRDPGFAYGQDPGALNYENSVKAHYEGGEEKPLSPSEVFDELVGSEEYNTKNPGPEPPACVELPECANTGGAWDMDSCSCSCEDGSHFQEDRGCVPDPPPSAADPTDYIHIDRVDGILNGTASRVGLMHWCPFTNWRDPLNVGTQCDDDVAQYLAFDSAAALVSFGEKDGMTLCVEGDTQITPQIQKENRRCDPENPNYDERFLKTDGTCARSEMRKSRLLDYRARLDPHQNRAIGLRARGGECRTAVVAAGGGAFDSVAGFCSSLNEAEAETGFTVNDCPNQ